MKRFLSLTGAAALIAGAVVLAGCGGGSQTATPAGPTNTVRGTATVTSTATTAVVTVPATNGSAQTLTVDGAATAVVIPSGASASIAPGTPLSVVKSGSTLLGGSFTAGTPVKVNGVAASGITVDATGAIAQNVALPIDTTQGTSYSFALPTGNLQTRALTVGETDFSGRYYVVNGSVVSPFPVGVTGKIPNNGESAVGSSVTVTFSAGNDGRTVHLKIVYGNGFILEQTKTIASSTVNFQDFATDSSNIPANGVESISMEVGNRQ